MYLRLNVSIQVYTASISMHAKYRDLRLRFMLPAAQLLLCLVALWPIRGMIVGGVWFAIQENRGERAYSKPGPIYLFDLQMLQPPRDESLTQRIKEQLIWIPPMLNLPSVLVEIPQAVLSPTHMSWSPRGMDFRIWRAISWPLIGILFWWIAGRGIDALIGARRRIMNPSIGWAETAVSIVALACGVIFCMLPFMVESENDRYGPWWQLLCIAGAIWVLLGGATIAARFVQFRVRRANS